MAKNAIEIELHGKRFGLSKDNDLVSNDKILIPGSPKNLVRLFDDFMGDLLNANWNGQKGSDAGSLVGVVNNQFGGVVRMAAGASATGTMATNGTQLAQGAFLNFKASNGGLAFECRLKTDVITSMCLFVGFTDQDAALEMPFTIAGAALTSNATDAVGFLYDTAATASTIKLVGVKNDVDATVQDTGVAPVAATYITLRVEVDVNENATFFINGVRVKTVMASALTKTIGLTPVIAAFTRGATTNLIDVDYVVAEAYRV